jgi:hypothetical protein
MRTLKIDLFKAQNTAPTAAYRIMTDIISACRMAGYVRSFDEYTVAITWPFAGPAAEKYKVLTDHGVPASCLKLRK